MSTPDIGDLIDTILPVLRRVGRLEVGDGEAPEPYATEFTLTDPGYGILDLVAGGDTEGDVARTSSIRTITLQLTGVGWRRDQAQWASMQMLHALLDVDAGGYKNPIPVPSCTIIDRRHVASGGVLHEQTLFNSVELVALTVSV